MMNNSRSDNIWKLLSERENFLVIAMTGRVGSGCSQVADILSSDVDGIAVSEIDIKKCDQMNNNERDKRILYEYYKCHWVPFDIIKVRTIIASFLLDDMDSFAGEMLRLGNSTSKGSQYSNIRDILRALQGSFGKQLKRNMNDQYDDEPFKDIKKILGKNGIDIDEWKAFHQMTKNAYESLGSRNVDYKKVYHTCKEFAKSKKDMFNNLYRKNMYDIEREQCNRYLKTINRCVYIFSAVTAQAWFCAKAKGASRDIWEEMARINNEINHEKGFKRFVFVHDLMPIAATVIHDELSAMGSDIFTTLFLKYGNSIRRYGKILYNNDVENGNYDIFEIPRKINSFIKALRHPFDKKVSRPERIVIDALKNPFEADYLRERYSAFYMFAISMNESLRRKALKLDKGKNLNDMLINFIDWNEYSKEGYDILEKYTKGMDILSQDEIQFAKKVNGEGVSDNDVLFDNVRKESYENLTYQFILQDVGNCIQNADVFISNKGKTQALKWDIIRNVCLMLYPGLVQPTLIERCMQIAFSAKVNSGCISRQVGAVVADANYKILSIGWNDVPCGDISCSRKNMIDLYNRYDVEAYTEYECKNRDFYRRIEEKCKKIGANTSKTDEASARLLGLPMRYCFKDVSSDVRSPMKSRARHGEEMALSMCGKECEGGYLFTTSSPCEMCAKNAKDHKIKTIYYIEPYPSLSEIQYTKSGDVGNRAKHVLFTGAVGRAYTQMYTPIMPHKDLLEHLTS